MTNPITQIVFNGCDNYIEVKNLTSDIRHELHGDGATVYTSREAFESFPVVKAKSQSIRDGEFNLDELFVTESGRIYRRA